MDRRSGRDSGEASCPSRRVRQDAQLLAQLMSENHFPRIGCLTPRTGICGNFCGIGTAWCKRGNCLRVSIRLAGRGYVMVRAMDWLVPPLVQPRLPVFPLGVLMVTLAVPGPEMTAVVSVTCNWELLRT